jgi:hypothetical protein
VPGEEVGLMLVAVVPKMKVMAMVMVAEVWAAKMATMPAARGRVTYGRERGDGECNHGNGGSEDHTRGSHGLFLVGGERRSGEGSNEKTRPGRIRPGGPFIATCLHDRGIADVDVAQQHRAPHPARPAANVETEVAVMTVVVVAVVVMTVVAMVTVMAVAMTAAMPAAGRRNVHGGEGRDGQRDSGNRGSEDSTLHGTSPGVDPERPSPWGYAR